VENEMPSKINIKPSKKLLEEFKALQNKSVAVETSVRMAMSYATEMNDRMLDTSRSLFERMAKQHKLDLRKCQMKFNPEDDSVTVAPHRHGHDEWAEIVRLLQEFTAKD